MPNPKNGSPAGEELNLENSTPSASESQTAPPEPPAASAGTGSGGGSGQGGKPKKPESGSDKKIGLVTFIQLTEPNKYVAAMLKNKRSMEAHTKAEWEQIVTDLLNQKVS